MQSAVQIVTRKVLAFIFTVFLKKIAGDRSGIAAVARKNWEHTRHSWICSACFVSGSKDDDPLSPDYVPLTVFSYQKPNEATQDLN